MCTGEYAGSYVTTQVAGVFLVPRPRRDVQTLAGLRLLERRDTLGIPHLIRLLTEDRMSPIRDKLSALVQATGVDSVPVPPNAGLEKMPKAQAFWASWWEHSSPRFRFATEKEGEAALLRWRGRWPEEDS
jgi:hypothetical protein